MRHVLLHAYFAASVFAVSLLRACFCSICFAVVLGTKLLVQIAEIMCFIISV